MRYIQYKPFACSGVIHSPVTAALNLKNRYGIRPEDIAEIQICTAEKMIQEFGEPFEHKTNPRTVVDAQFSMPFSVALIFCRGSALLDDYTDEIIGDENIRRVARLVKSIADPEIGNAWPMKEPSEVTVRTVDGKVLVERVEGAKGSLLNPMTREELIEKYKTLASRALGDAEISSSLDFLLNLEGESDVSKLIDILSGGKRGSK